MTHRRDILERAFAFAEALEDVEDREALRETVARTVRSVVSCDIASYNEFGPGGAAHYAVSPNDPFASAELRAAFEAHVHEHPIVAHVARSGETGTHRISDFVTDRVFERSAIYNEFYRELSIRRQLALSFVEDGALIGVALNRSGREFSDDERDQLDCVRPFVRAALRRIALVQRLGELQELVAGSFVSDRHAVVFVASEGTIDHASPLAAEWLCEHFPAALAASALPDVLRRWLRVCGRGASERRSVAERSQLLVRALRGVHQTVLLLERTPRSAPPATTLSRREREVLERLALGETNATIGEHFGISTRTVQTHTRRLFHKLGVENRTRAVSEGYRLGLIAAPS